MIAFNLNDFPDYAEAEARRSSLRQERNRLKDQVADLESRLAALGDEDEDSIIDRQAARLLNGGMGGESFADLESTLREAKAGLAAHERALGTQKVKVADIRAERVGELQLDMLADYRALVRESALAALRLARANDKIAAVRRDLHAVGVMQSQILPYAEIPHFGSLADPNSRVSTWFQYLADRHLLTDEDGRLLDRVDQLVED